MTQTATPTANETEILKSELASSKEINSLLERQVDDLKQQRDDWKAQTQATQRLLEDHSKRPRHSIISGLSVWLDNLKSQQPTKEQS